MEYTSTVLVSVVCGLLCLATGFELKTGIEFRLYQTTLQKWHDKDHMTTLQDLMVSEANIYCSETPSDCGLPYWNSTYSFRRDDIILSEGYPKLNEDLYVRFSVHANFTSSANPWYVLDTTVTTAIFLRIKERLEEATGTYVTYIDERFYGIPPDGLANRVIISVACCVLIVVIVIAVVLSVCNKKKEKETIKQQIKKLRRASTKASLSRHNSSFVQNGGRRIGDMLQKHYNENELIKDNTNNAELKIMERKQISPVTENHSDHMMNHTNQSDIWNTSAQSAAYTGGQQASSENTSQTGIQGNFRDDASYLNDAVQRHNELPPLNQSDTDQELRREKRHKRRKSRKKKHEKEGVVNPALLESQSETETFTHQIMNVQPNNLIAEETVL